MKKILIAVVMSLMTLSTFAQEDAFFDPYKNISLRLPSVPLIMNDPFISFWSPYNKLTDGTTRHWTNIEKPMDGLLRVDGKLYRWMGQQKTHILANPLLPMVSDEKWSAKTYISTTALTGTDWTQEDFDDSAWEVRAGAFGCPKGKYADGEKECGDDWHTNVATEWYEEGSNLYIRRHVNLTAEDLAKDLYVKFSHDDYFYLYINGKQIVNTGNLWRANVTQQITEEMKAYLHEGDNVIAVRCENRTGGAYCDYGLYENIKTVLPEEEIARQTAVDVLACNTYYTFRCGDVMLDVVFTAPMIIDDLESISVPINYISYRVTSRDDEEHDVQFYFGITPEMTIYKTDTETVSRITTKNDIKYAYAGARTQNVLKRVGDMIPIDWGYIYIPAIGGDVCIADCNHAESEFAADGKITTTKNTVLAKNITQYPTLAYIKDFGKTTNASSYMMIGYDEKLDIQYHKVNYPGYWARDGKTIFEAFEEMRDKYWHYMMRSRDMDKIIYDDAYNATKSKKYAELLSGTYRHVLAAHKLFEDNEGNLLYFSKENNSNGCVNTMDLTYPSSSLFFCYNPALQKGMSTSIIEYCYTGKWPYNFAAHDLGTYPHANGNVYGNPNSPNGDTMPLEESANAIILTAYNTKLDGDLDYLKKYWDVLTSWTQFLVDNGKEPGNQLCTDDFKGHSSRNANLAVKAIMGIASYAEMCKMLGYNDEYQKHMDIAHEYAHYWVDNAKADDHYSMEFEKPDTWGLKYNMLWDKIWGWNIFNSDYTGDVMATEMKYYKTKIRSWGLPLDGRDWQGKADWAAWIAAMTDNTTDFNLIMDAEWKFANETQVRWPLSDWHWTDSNKPVGFRARSVLGGLWAKVLVEKNKGTLPEVETGITNTTTTEAKETVRYNMNGQRLTAPEKGINIVKYSNGVVRKEIVK